VQQFGKSVYDVIKDEKVLEKVTFDASARLSKELDGQLRSFLERGRK
jgi:hypothetical protein